MVAKTTIVHISITSCKHSSRVFKEAKSAIKNKIADDVVIFAVKKDNLSSLETISDSVRVCRISLGQWPGFIGKIIKYIKFSISILFRLSDKSVLLVHAHSASTLPIAALLKFVYRTKLVYDAHELEVERNGLSGLRKQLVKLVERSIIRYCDKVLVVSPSISTWYSDYYKIDEPLVIMNIPLSQVIDDNKNISMRKRLELDDDDIIFLYLGGFSEGRGVISLLETFSKLGFSKYHLVFMGYGSLEDIIRKHSEIYPNIHLLPAVKPDEVLTFSREANVGVCLIENTCLSYYYSLPNKLFEYIISGVPVIINDFPDQKTIIQKYNCGWVIGKGQKLEDVMDMITAKDILNKKEGAIKASLDFGWEKEEIKLVEMYKNLIR